MESPFVLPASTRLAKKDPAAIHYLGTAYYYGRLGVQKDLRKAVELYTEAAEHGSIQALYFLGFSYTGGRGVEVDKGKGTISSSSRKGPCKGVQSAGTVLAFMREMRGTTTVQ